MERKTLNTGSCYKIVNGTYGFHNSDKYNFVRIVCDGTFMEQFDLINFPFDCQNLSIVMDITFDLKESALIIPWDESFDIYNDGTSYDKHILQLNRHYSALTSFSCKRVLIDFAIKHNIWSQVTMRFQIARKPEGVLGRIGTF